MSHSVVGVVDNSYTKQKTSRAGKSFTINYIDVDGVTVSTGFDSMFEQGEHIDIEVEEKFKEWQFKAQGGKGLPAAGAKAKFTPRAAATGGGGGFTAKGKGSFPVDPKDGQMSIIRQSSMNRAVEIMDQLVKHGIYGPVSQEEYMDLLVNIALEITDFASGNDITQIKALQKEVVNG